MSHKKSNEYIGYHGPGTGGGVRTNELVDLQTLSTQRQDRLVNALKERYQIQYLNQAGSGFPTQTCQF